MFEELVLAKAVRIKALENAIKFCSGEGYDNTLTALKLLKDDVDKLKADHPDDTHHMNGFDECHWKVIELIDDMIGEKE